MIYVKVAHTNDEDSDYFKFDNLRAAYVQIEYDSVVDYVISDSLIDNVPEDDYDYLEVLP
jgi:hypothetical protein